MAKIARLLALLTLLGAVAGCSLFEGPRPWPNERRIVSRDWAKPQIDQSEPPVYCYRTLAAVECHAAPLPGAEARMVSAYDGADQTDDSER
ncbi:MAG TPA: hypothetical protein VF274_01015 [Alphaproteobacteria bacterium]